MPSNDKMELSNNSITSSNSSSTINTQRYKTELCRQFNENGDCKYGDKCQFAHGLHELKDINRHPKYKTDLCKTYHSKGFCPYGPRCHFIHDSSEKRETYTRRTNLLRSTRLPLAATQITQSPRALSTSSSSFSSGISSPIIPSSNTTTSSPLVNLTYALNNDALLIQWLLQLQLPKQAQYPTSPTSTKSFRF